MYLSNKKHKIKKDGAGRRRGPKYVNSKKDDAGEEDDLNMLI